MTDTCPSPADRLPPPLDFLHADLPFYQESWRTSELRNLPDYREKSLIENFPLILILSPCVCARLSSVRNCHPLFQLACCTFCQLAA